MSPTADQLAEKIGRDLREGDILTSLLENVRCFEVVNPKIIKDGAACVSVAELTPYGRVEETRIYSRDSNVWRSIIRRENRTDRPLRER